MTENLQRVFEELTKDCTQEDKAKILKIVEPGETGQPKERAKVELTNGEIERIKPILDKFLEAIDKEKEQLEQLALASSQIKCAEDLKKAAAAQEEEYKTKSEQFKKQLEEAHKMSQKHYRSGLDFVKAHYLCELERAQAWEGITNAFNYGFMMGYKAAQRKNRKKTKAAADKQEGAKRA